MESAGLPLLTELLKNRQVRLYQKICQMPSTELVKSLVCDDTGLQKLGGHGAGEEDQGNIGQNPFMD